VQNLSTRSTLFGADTTYLSRQTLKVTIQGDFHSSFTRNHQPNNMFNTPKRSNQQTSSIMCPPPPTRTRTSSRACPSAPSFSSSTAQHNVSSTSLASIFAEVDLWNSYSPMEIDGLFFLTPPVLPAFPSLTDENLDPIKLQPRPCRQLSCDDGHQAKLKPRSSRQCKF